ncbi:hypothetical protein [Helicobacter cynogastricus]|uniref:hypothetical protein n=1 Tax=Helicobacter cynogastricus TaxID=329937 RepID=UPI000CF0ED33|nr:hypothetical protein [Helicobacter cynogastricus]
MDVLVQNIKQENLSALLELANKLGFSVEVFEPKPSDLEIFACTPADGATMALKEKECRHEPRPHNSRICNSYYNPLNTHRRDHKHHTENAHNRHHRDHGGHNGPSEPFL